MSKHDSPYFDPRYYERRPATVPLDADVAKTCMECQRPYFGHRTTKRCSPCQLAADERAKLRARRNAKARRKEARVCPRS